MGKMEKPPIFMDGIPVIVGPNKQPEKMRNIIQFLQTNDTEKPDFVKLCASEGSIRVACAGGETMNEEEK